MPVLISDLWTPPVWVAEMRERQATFPSLFNSGIVQRGEQFDAIATGPGLTANIPFWKDLSDQVDEIQVENTAPAIDNGAPTGLQIATILNRVTKNSATALSAQVSGGDPVGQITSALVGRRLKQRQKTLIALLRGAFNGLGAAAAAAPLLAVRLDSFDESGVGASAAQTMSVDLFINAVALLGELAEDVAGGAILMHPTPQAALEKADAASFKEGSLSGMPFKVKTYRGVPIFLSESLVRAGGTDGFVYDSYILGRGSVAYGEKEQQGDTIDVASLQYEEVKSLNNQTVYDRTRFLLHLNGMKWVGTPAGQSATNAELAVAANWNLVSSSANRVGAVSIRTNA